MGVEKLKGNRRNVIIAQCEGVLRLFQFLPLDPIRHCQPQSRRWWRNGNRTSLHKGAADACSLGQGAREREPKPAGTVQVCVFVCARWRAKVPRASELISSTDRGGSSWEVGKKTPNRWRQLEWRLRPSSGPSHCGGWTLGACARRICLPSIQRWRLVGGGFGSSRRRPVSIIRSHQEQASQACIHTHTATDHSKTDRVVRSSRWSVKRIKTIYQTEQPCWLGCLTAWPTLIDWNDFWVVEYTITKACKGQIKSNHETACKQTPGHLTRRPRRARPVAKN